MSENVGIENKNKECGPINIWPDHLYKYLGETVTIFTSSGGESGSGFTGVLMTVNDCFVRLLSRIGPPPGCSLGNSCNGFNIGPGQYGHGACGIAGGFGGYKPGMRPVLPSSYNGAITAGGWGSVPVYTVGSVTDIPVDSIVSFVHNAV